LVGTAITIFALLMAALVPASALLVASRPGERRRQARRLAITWPILVVVTVLVLLALGPIRHSHGAGPAEAIGRAAGGGGGSW
jgi:hypothetical protein